MSDVDRLLEEAGARWRESQPDPPIIDFSTLVLPARARYGWWHAALVVAAVAVVGGVVVVGGGRLGLNTTPANGAPPAVTLAGDRVQGTGIVVIDPSGQARLCIPEGVRLRNYPPGAEPPPTCSPIAVPLQGLDPSRLPGRRERDGVVYSGRVTVKGVWTGDVVVVETVAEAEPDQQQAAPLSCLEPAEGWPRLPADGDLEAALARVAEIVAEAPDVYAGYWTVPSPDGKTRVLVVGTVRSVDDARAAVASAYPYGTCVVAAKFSLRELQDAADALARPDRTWQTELDLELNRVRVRMAVVDEDARRTLVSYPQASAVPLIARFAE